MAQKSIRVVNAINGEDIGIVGLDGKDRVSDLYRSVQALKSMQSKLFTLIRGQTVLYTLVRTTLASWNDQETVQCHVWYDFGTDANNEPVLNLASDLQAQDGLRLLEKLFGEAKNIEAGVTEPAEATAKRLEGLEKLHSQLQRMFGSIQAFPARPAQQPDGPTPQRPEAANEPPAAGAAVDRELREMVELLPEHLGILRERIIAELEVRPGEDKMVRVRRLHGRWAILFMMLELFKQGTQNARARGGSGSAEQALQDEALCFLEFFTLWCKGHDELLCP